VSGSSSCRGVLRRVRVRWREIGAGDNLVAMPPVNMTVPDDQIAGERYPADFGSSGEEGGLELVREPIFRGPARTDWGFPKFTGKEIWNDLRSAFRGIIHQLVIEPVETRRLHRNLARASGPVKVSVGSGAAVPESDWIGLDYCGGDRVYGCDLRKPLPLKDKTVDIILAEHIVEHFWLDDIPGFLSELYRILKPGGIVRVVCPDALIVCALLQGMRSEKTEMQIQLDARVHGWDFKSATPLRVANRITYEFGNHKSLLTESALVELVAEAGFKGIRVTSLDKSVYLKQPPGTHLAEFPDAIHEAIVVEAKRVTG